MSAYPVRKFFMYIHYENMPMQYTESFYAVKMKISLEKNINIFFSKHRLWVRTIYVLEQNKKNRLNLVHPSFTI